jgi:hypothetical protein
MKWEWANALFIVKLIKNKLTMNNILSPKITHLEEEIDQLQTVMHSKKAQIDTIQSLFLQASLAFNTLKEASRHIPIEFRPHVEQQIWNILQLTKSPSPKEAQGTPVNKKKAKPSPQGFQSDKPSKKKKTSKTKQPVSEINFQSIRKPTKTKNKSFQNKTVKTETLLSPIDCLWKASQNILGGFFLKETRLPINSFKPS